MLRTCKTLTVAALLAATTPLVALAGGAGQSDNKELGKKVDELRGAIETLTRKVDGLKSEATTDKAALDDIRRRLGAVEKTLEAMQPPPGFNDRGRSSYPPPGGANGGAGVGRVVLRNNYGGEVTLILNNRAQYRIAAFDTMDIGGVPAGILNYEVFVEGWGPRAARTTTLEPGKAVSLVVQ